MIRLCEVELMALLRITFVKCPLISERQKKSMISKSFLRSRQKLQKKNESFSRTDRKLFFLKNYIFSCFYTDLPQIAETNIGIF